MKNKAILFLAIAILGIATYLFFQKKKHYLSTLKEFIPDNTLLLLETNELKKDSEPVLFSQIPLLSKVENQFYLLQKIGLSKDEVNDLMSDKVLYFALLPEAKEDLGYISYLPLTQNDSVLVNKINTLQENISGSRIIYHTTRGYRIAEVIDGTAKSVLSFFIQNDVLIFSASSVLIEEAILPSKHVWIKSIADLIAPQSESIFTATHLNKAAVAKFIDKISANKNQGAKQFINLLSENFTNFQLDEDLASAIGDLQGVNPFEGQTPKRIEDLSMIPNTSSFLLYIPFDDTSRLTENLQQYFKENKTLNTLRNTVKAAFKLNFSDIYQQLEGEILLAGFDEGDETFNGKALILRNKAMLEILKKTAKEVSKEKNANVVTVEYGGYTIKSLGIREFPTMLFGEYFSGFEECFFTEYKNYIILTNSLSAMQSYLLMISKGDVWSNSTKNQSIIKKCNASNLTLIAETNRAVLGFKKSLLNAWAVKFAAQIAELNRIQVSVFEIHDGKTQLKLFKNAALAGSSRKYANKWIKLSSIEVDSASKPFYVINPLSKKQEIFAQGLDNQLYYIKSGKKVWSYQLSSKVIGDIKNIKISANAPQQLLIATSNKVYILKKNTKGFDVQTIQNNSGVPIRDFIIFDNEFDKKENITLFSSNGSTFKIDKNTLSLSLHHKPKNAGSHILPISTLIMQGVEYAILLDKKGKLTLQDANGNIADGFPIALNRIFNDPALIEGSNERISIKVLSENGELFTVNVSGKIIERKQLLRPNAESKFFLCVDQRNTDWVIMRSDGKDVTVIDQSEKEIFTIKEETFGVKRLKYYNLGVGGKYFALTNSYTNYRFFDETGSYVGGMPIISNYLPLLTYSESYQKLIIDILTPTALENWSVKLR